VAVRCAPFLSNQAIRVTTSGKKKSFTVGSGPQLCVGPDSALWFAGGAQAVRMTTAGRTKFYNVPGSTPALDQIAAGPDGAMWFASAAAPPAIGRITTGR
jgi:virginiamycin B lyase